MEYWNIKYWLTYPVIAPLYFLDWVIFRGIKNRHWDSVIWLHRILIWHDNLFRSK